MMKKIILFFYILFASIGIAQTSPKVVVQTDKMKTLYYGIENPITVVVEGVSDEKISVSTKTGIIMGEKGKYLVTPGGYGNMPMKIYIMVDNKIIDSVSFKLIQLPDPVVFLGGKYLIADAKFIELRKIELSSLSVLVAKNIDFDFDATWTVLSFEMSLLSEQPKTFISSSQAFSPEMKTFFSEVKSGQSLIFDRITVKGPDGKTRAIPSLLVKVK
jgi:hypothetical protein